MNTFLDGFAEATGLSETEVDEQWAGFSRQLSDTERERTEALGYEAGLIEGRAWALMFPRVQN